ncbi:MAG: hypothetical protein K2Q32_05280, partial [Alphaproteobacteria bacterium]|nr:hypothetical protein [Alphaproteobacteria bacterium]
QELYPEFLKELKASKAFSNLRTSDNLDILVSEPDENGKTTLKLVVKNSPYASIGNARQTALDAITKVIDTRFKPPVNQL